MKKVLVLLLATVMLLSALTACTNTETTPNTGTSTNATDGTNSQITSDPKSEKITFEELTVVDNDECVIKITGIKENGLWGYTLNTYLENKSSEKTYMFSIKEASINGVSDDPLFAKEVVAGKKATSDITFPESGLKENGISKFTDIELTFRVYDNDNWSADGVAEETVHVYPYGQDKAERFVREAKDTDTVIVDNEYVTIILTGYDKDNIWGYSAELFLVNKTDKEVMFSVDGASVNGYMADPFWAKSVSAGKCAFSSMSWSDSVLEENNITEIETIEASFKARDNSDFMGDDYANVQVTLNP